MKYVTVILVVPFVICGCASRSGNRMEQIAEVAYFDRNGDGNVDLEHHSYPGVADANWELRDDDYSGRYEKKILYEFAVKESIVDLPAPTGVKFEKKP